MKRMTLRGRIALWSVAVVIGALTLFGAGAAWTLHRELLESLDRQIQDGADAFAAELDEQKVDWNQRRKTESFADEDLPRFPYVEVQDAKGRVLYRSPALGGADVFPSSVSARPYEVTLNGRRVRFALFRRGTVTFALGKDLHSVDEALAGLLRAYLFTLPLVVFVVGAGGWLIAHRAVAPIRAIAAQAEKISASDLDQRLPGPVAEDEIAHLTQVLNQMFHRLQQSFEQLTRFTSDASHELKTPLALLRAQAESVIASSAAGEAEQELAAEIIAQSSRLTQIVDGLLFLSRAEDRCLGLDDQPVDLSALVRELSEDAEILAAEANLILRSHLAAEVVVSGDAPLLRRSIMNLIDNAIKYNRPGGSVTLSSMREDGCAAVTVGSTGPGLPEGFRDKIFERFYRGEISHRREPPGHGLGLSIAREIARAHGGDVVLGKCEGEWTEFSLRLPLAPVTDLTGNGSAINKATERSTAASMNDSSRRRPPVS